MKSIKSQYGLVNEVSIDAVMLRILTNCSVMTKSMITALTGKKLRVSDLTISRCAKLNPYETTPMKPL